MKEKNGLIIKLFELLTFIILYYAIGIKNLFLYVISFCLYNIFIAAFNHISITKSLSKVDNKYKLFCYLLLTILLISIMFLLLGILISDIISIVLNINDTLIIFLFMGLSIITKPFIKLLSEYLVSVTNNHKFTKIINIYHILDYLFMIIIAIFVFKLFRVPLNIAIGLLYISKIISALLILILMYLINRDKKTKHNNNKKDTFNYKKEIKNILIENSYRSLILVVKNGFYYVSVIVLYVILLSRYNYELDVIWKDITFVYLFGICIVNLVIDLVKVINIELPQEMTLTSRIYNNFKIMLSAVIIFSIVSPLTCKILFNEPRYAIYLGMLNFMAIFSLLYDITYGFIKNKRIIYIGLVIGFLIKVITVIPLINAFYRMGYNLIYGDILSTVLGFSISMIINYVYIRNKEKTNENYFTKLLNIFYDNIILCIILVLIEFIIPINTDNYFKSLGLLIIYLVICLVIIKLKNIKRG